VEGQLTTGIRRFISHTEEEGQVENFNDAIRSNESQKEKEEKD